MRPTIRREMQEGGRTKQADKSLTKDTGKIWNQTPDGDKRSKEHRSIQVSDQKIL